MFGVEIRNKNVGANVWKGAPLHFLFEHCGSGIVTGPVLVLLQNIIT